MHALYLLGISAFLMCLYLTPICRDLFFFFGLVDQPDSDRKFHLRPVPRMGGIPIALSYGFALLLTWYFNPNGSRIYVQHQGVFLALLPAAAVVFTTGLLDDVFGLKPWQKLAGQLVGAILAVSLGASLSLNHVPFWVSACVSVVWLIACANAINLIDGMDGLATGVGLLATLCTLVVAIRGGNVGLALATVPLAGCLLGFLRYNFSPASVFLGDCGSLTIGFVLGCFSLIWSQKDGTVLGVVAPLMALALPLIDVCLAIGRRFLRARPIFQGDRGHIHHMVLSKGFSTRSAVLLLYGVCCICASLAILASMHNRGLGWPIFFLFCILVVVGIARLGYVEFAAARKIVSTLFLRRAVQDQIFLEELTLAMDKAENPDSWWQIVRTASSHLNFASAHMELFGCSFKEQFTDHHDSTSCSIHLGLGDGSFLLLTRTDEHLPPRAMMSILANLQNAIRSQVSALDLAPHANQHTITRTAA